MAGLAGTFGIAVPNFTAYPQMPDVKALVEYGVTMEQLGFDSLWVWDHILLGVEPNFPDHRIADAAHRDRRPHQQDQARHRHSRAADAQSGRSSPSSSRAWTCCPTAGC